MCLVVLLLIGFVVWSRRARACLADLVFGALLLVVSLTIVWRLVMGAA